MNKRVVIDECVQQEYSGGDRCPMYSKQQWKAQHSAFCSLEIHIKCD